MLGVAGFDALDGNPQAQPPHRQPAQSKQGVWRGEGDAIVGPDGGGQSEFLENAFEYRESTGFLSRLQGFTCQQIARAVVSDREWIAIAVVAEPELSLIVGASHYRGRFARNNN